MDRNETKNIRVRLQSIIDNVFKNDPVFKDYRVEIGGGSFTNSDLRIKLIISDIVNNDITKTLADKNLPVILRHGYAPAGTPILLSDGRKGTIIRARRVKYEVRVEGDHRLWLVRFSSARLDESRIPKIAAVS